MSIKYEIHSIKNSEGTGRERRFARIFEHEPKTGAQLEKHIQDNCSLTKGDVQATLMTLRDCLIHELSQGNRVHIPEIGYFSLSVELDMPEDTPTDKARGDYISVRNIRFRPENSLLDEVRQNARFERAKFSTKSPEYDEDGLWQRVKSFLSANGCMTRRDMETEFGLRQSAALRWLRHFAGKGLLRKDGARSAPVYFDNTTGTTGNDTEETPDKKPDK